MLNLVFITPPVMRKRPREVSHKLGILLESNILDFLRVVKYDIAFKQFHR